MWQGKACPDLPSGPRPASGGRSQRPISCRKGDWIGEQAGMWCRSRAISPESAICSRLTLRKHGDSVRPRF
eukprot:7705118-Heterocapsa_arctica.AAC.1